MIICLIRHGQTAWNQEGKIQGLTDNKLNEQGRLEAMQVAVYLKNHDPHWDGIYTSPLSVAHETGTIIASYLGLASPTIHPGLQERNFGILEGTSITEHTFPSIMQEQIPGMEKKAALQARALKTIGDIFAKHQNDRILITTHSHFIKALVSTIIPAFDFGTLLYNASLSYMEVSKEQIKLLAFNQVAK
ncbi:MAG TPA: histidine phosphatase family protein [Bacilli bacterium]|nr:MAG: 2,3-bisphosphoglycerate-dependent phosphoglycerate mutase [Tenericutes bacterium ADurb.BinA124]HNZ50219.1 histidine phosphatase family protein [Bacilli bacterium]HPX83904.1 histidine phosphatase family protein [Bacilli bacterium]